MPRMGQSRSKRPSGSDLEEAAPHQAAASGAATARLDVGIWASTSMLTGDRHRRHPPEARLLVLVEQLVRRVHRLRRASAVGTTLVMPTSAIWTATAR